MGWRNIVEKMHMSATLSKWYEEYGRHEIFAGGKPVNLETIEHSLLLRDEIVTKDVQHDLDELGIAKNARDEKRRKRAMNMSQADHERMAKLYRQHILKEEAKPDTQIVQLKINKPKPQQEITPAGFGD
jgi:hypothetical protein